MAQEITGPNYGGRISARGQKRSVADQTANSTAMQFTNAARWVFARVYQKAFTAGSGSARVEYILEGDTVNTFDSVNLIRAGQATVRREDEQAAFIIGFSPLRAFTFWRVRIVLDGTDAATYDAILEGV